MKDKEKNHLKNLVTTDSGDSPFFIPEEVKLRKQSTSYKPLDIVKILLRERALKQSELAEKIGLSRQALHNYLRGFWTAPTAIKIKVSQALGVDSSVIWDLPQEVKK